MNDARRTDLSDQKAALVAYCRSKLAAGDWHAVQDAASDIRELDAKLDLLNDLASQGDGNR
jgi:hypothetical protein